MVRKIVFIDFLKCIECCVCEVVCECEYNGRLFINVFEW